MRNNPFTLTNKLNINLKFNKVIKRTMLTRAKNFVQTTSQKTTLFANTTKNYSTQKPYKFTKPNSSAVKELATDDSGKHVHLIEETCEQKECETKTCPSLCDKAKEMKPKGHFTHGPKAGKFSKQVSDVDANGAKKGQYFTKNCDKNKKVSGQKADSYKTNKEIKVDAKMHQYLQKSEIADKFKNS